MIEIDRKRGLNHRRLVMINVIVRGLTRFIAYIDFSAFSRVCLGGRRNVRPRVRCSRDLHTTVPHSRDILLYREEFYREEFLHMVTILCLQMNEERNDGGDMALASQFVQIER